MSLLDCYPTLVGLTDIECPCDTIPQDKKYNVSESITGWYLTDLVSINVGKVQRCDEASDLFDNMRKALVKGATKVEGSYSTAISSIYQKAIPSYKGVLGTSTENETGTAHPFGGIEIKCHQRYAGGCNQGIEGAEMIVNKIYHRTKQAQNLNFKIMRSDGVEMWKQLNVAVLPNTRNEIEVGITLPLYWDENESLSYYVLSNDQNPLYNIPTCNCGGNVAKRYKKYSSIYGSCENASGDYVQDRFAYGIQVDCEMSCTTKNALCNIPWEHQKQLAVALLSAGGCEFIDWALSRNDPNAATYYDRENLMQTHMKLTNDMNTAIEWLASNAELGECFVCGQAGFGVKSILK